MHFRSIRVFDMFRGARFLYFNSLKIRNYCAKVQEHQRHILRHNADEIEFDWRFLTNDNNRSKIKQNILDRKGVGNIDELVNIYNTLIQIQPGSEEYYNMKKMLLLRASEIPNMTHPEAPIGAEDKATTLNIYGREKKFDFTPRSMRELGRINERFLQTYNVAKYTGPRTYYFLKELAELESALVRYTFDYLMKNNFNIISVPDLIPTIDVERCGFKTSGKRTRVYKVDPNLCLAGTGEMSIASYLSNKVLTKDKLPMRLATVSRCFRAETSDIERERGLFRVHQFTKVEMFGVTEEGSSSEEFLNEFVRHQVNLFSELDLHFRVLDMPTQELGASAFRKFDIETFLPGKGFWGEISSASNCTDYQSRRLNIKYEDNGVTKFCHTINGTACAVPRMVIALMESFQEKDGSVILPNTIIPYMSSKERINVRKPKIKKETPA